MNNDNIYNYHDKDGSQMSFDITDGMLASDYFDSRPLPSTSVYNLDDNVEINYSLRPHEALRSAYEQFDRKNWNTWEYKTLREYPFKLVNNRTLILGKWSCSITGVN